MKKRKSKIINALVILGLGGGITCATSMAIADSCIPCPPLTSNSTLFIKVINKTKAGIKPFLDAAEAVSPSSRTMYQTLAPNESSGWFCVVNNSGSPFYATYARVRANQNDARNVWFISPAFSHDTAWEENDESSHASFKQDYSSIRGTARPCGKGDYFEVTFN